MAPEPAKAASDLTQAGLLAWGKALVKTGTKHLDLGMVRQGKQTLKEAAGAEAPAAKDNTPA